VPAQRQLPILAALAFHDTDDHALAVDVADLQPRYLGATHAGILLMFAGRVCISRLQTSFGARVQSVRLFRYPPLLYYRVSLATFRLSSGNVPTQRRLHRN
jgi:hypothetical protein